MEVYLPIIFLLIFFSYFDLVNLKQNQKWAFLGIIFILLVFQDGFRWETGTDWVPYKNYFVQGAGYVRQRFECGYEFLNNIVYSVSQNYSVFLIFHAVIIYSLFLKSINDYTKYPLITALCFYCTFIGYMGSNRQLIALALCIFAFRYIVSREIWKFLFFVIVASLFHLSAVPFFIAYFLNRRIPRYVYVIAFIAAFMFIPIIVDLSNRILSALPGHSLILERLRIRTIAAANEKEIINPILNVIFGLIKRIIIFLAVYFNLTKLKEKVPSVKLMLNIYFISILIYIMFNNNVQTFVGRGGLYFGSLFEIFLLPSLIYIFRKKSMGRLTIFTVIVILMVMNAFRSITVDLFTPYKGLYINTGYSRKMW